MGGMDDYEKKSIHRQSSSLRAKIKIFLLVLVTNLLTFLLFADHNMISLPAPPTVRFWDSSAALVSQLNSTQTEFSTLRTRLESYNSLFKTLLSQLNRPKNDAVLLPDWRDDLNDEAKLAVGPHDLPFGFTKQLDTDQLYPSLGSACRNFPEDLNRYMSYNIGGVCPTDDIFAQKLLLRGCEPLPRRRCHPKSPVNYADPVPFPKSLWTIPPDTSITWDPYTCKNYSCLENRMKTKGSYDCKDCFDLSGREKTRWLYDGKGIDYGIDAVLAMRPKGTIRIGLDIGGGSGTFAARMRKRDVTIVTSSMNFDGPFNSFISSRGLLAVHISVANRLPFFDNTLDIVHSMHVLSNWIPDTMLEFALYDIYRVLRPGGIFWLDHFFCVGGKLNATYVPMFGRIGFGTIRWNAGRKMDQGAEKNEWYISALLEKPVT